MQVVPKHGNMETKYPDPPALALSLSSIILFQIWHNCNELWTQITNGEAEGCHGRDEKVKRVGVRDLNQS